MKMVKIIPRLEYLLFFIVSFFFFINSDGNPVIFILALLFVDISMAGYLIDRKVGAVIYNVFHNYIFGILILALGILASYNPWVLAGFVVIAHISMDRFFGFGLKTFEGFKSTHLGKLG